MSLPRLTIALILAALLSAAANATQQASCSFDTFSAPSGYTLSMIQGVGDDGTVVGQLVDNNTLAYVGFVRSPNGSMKISSAPKSSITWMYGHIAAGTTAGSYLDNSGSPHVHGFILSGSNYSELDHSGSSNTWLFDVNQLGNYVGSYSSGNVIKGFLLVNKNYTTIAYPNQQSTYAMGMNDNNAVVGSYASGEVNNGFLWQNGKFTTINYPNSRYGTVLVGINNSGLIIGNHISADKEFGFLYENNTFENIVYSGAKSTIVGGVNNNGLISGLIFITSSKMEGYTATCK